MQSMLSNIKHGNMTILMTVQDRGGPAQIKLYSKK